MMSLQSGLCWGWKSIAVAFKTAQPGPAEAAQLFPAGTDEGAHAAAADQRSVQGHATRLEAAAPLKPSAGCCAPGLRSGLAGET